MHRSGLVAKDIKTNNDGTLRSDPPPPLTETLQYLLRRAARSNEMSIMHIDVTWAYVYASASCDIYVMLPVEDQAEGEAQMFGMLKKAMYWTKDAAQNRLNTCMLRDNRRSWIRDRQSVVLPRLQQELGCLRSGALRRLRIRRRQGAPRQDREPREG